MFAIVGMTLNNVKYLLFLTFGKVYFGSLFLKIQKGGAADQGRICDILKRYFKYDKKRRDHPYQESFPLILTQNRRFSGISTKTRSNLIVPKN